MVIVMEMISNGNECSIFVIHLGNCDSNLENNCRIRIISLSIISLHKLAIANANLQLEHENVPGVVESLKVVTEKNTERLCRFAFDYARENGRKKVTVVHKAVRRSILYLCLIYTHRYFSHNEENNIK